VFENKFQGAVGKDRNVSKHKFMP